MSAAVGIDADAVDNLFSFHPGTEVTNPLHAAVRETCRATAHDLLGLCPASAERTTAIRKLQEAMFFANASIACHGAPTPPETGQRGY